MQKDDSGMIRGMVRERGLCVLLLFASVSCTSFLSVFLRFSLSLSFYSPCQSGGPCKMDLPVAPAKTAAGITCNYTADVFRGYPGSHDRIYTNFAVYVYVHRLQSGAEQKYGKAYSSKCQGVFNYPIGIFLWLCGMRSGLDAPGLSAGPCGVIVTWQ